MYQFRDIANIKNAFFMPLNSWQDKSKFNIEVTSLWKPNEVIDIVFILDLSLTYHWGEQILLEGKNLHRSHNIDKTCQI